MKYDIIHEGTKVGTFELSDFLGCKRVCISHALEILPEYRGKGHGTKAQQERPDLARSLGYNVMMATVVEGNLPQEKILQQFGWKRITHFNNLKTGNNVVLWSKNLTDPYEDSWEGNIGCG